MHISLLSIFCYFSQFMCICVDKKDDLEMYGRWKLWYGLGNADNSIFEFVFLTVVHQIIPVRNIEKKNNSTRGICMCLANILFAASRSFCDRDGARSFETNTVGIWHVPDTHGFNTNHYMKCFTSNDILSLLSIFCCVFVWIRRMICQDLFSGKVMISSPFLIYPFPNKPTLKMDIKIAMALECYVSNLVYTVCMQFLYFFNYAL